MNAVEQMRLFMEPRSVAIIGVTRRTGPASFNILENMLKLGFGGKLYAVNPNASEVLGIRSYPSVKDISQEVDLAVIITPREIVPGIVRECTEKGIKAIIVVSQGFADAEGEEGKALQREIVDIARGGGARILGPNTFGTANAFCNLSTTFVKLTHDEGLIRTPLALICQSGLPFYIFPHIGCGKMIDLGNSSDIDFSEALAYLEDDPQTKVIAMHMEGLSNGTRFLEVASRVAKEKPLIVLKTARTEAGKRAVQSHTGALAGRDEVFSAVFKRCGLIQLSDFEEFEDACKSFLYLPPMKGGGLGILSYSGGGGIAALDACHDYSLEVAELQPKTVRKLGKLTPPWFHIGNLVDMGIALTTYKGPFMDAFQSGLEILLADPGVHAVLIIGAALSPTPGQGDVWDISKPILAAAEKFSDKPIVCWLYGPYVQESAQVLEGHGGVAVFPSCERAIRALAHQRGYMEGNP